jgi:hypothetical protein
MHAIIVLTDADTDTYIITATVTDWESHDFIRDNALDKGQRVRIFYIRDGAMYQTVTHNPGDLTF